MSDSFSQIIRANRHVVDDEDPGISLGVEGVDPCWETSIIPPNDHTGERQAFAIDPLLSYGSFCDALQEGYFE